MKVNKLISKGLALGFLLNSASILSYASTEIPNRYQTLEGEYITIEGNIENIEIFGNTVQDSNNLSNIQSSGDLYVDKEGNPILDKQGRKQYKIDIMSSNKNLFESLNFDNATEGVHYKISEKDNRQCVAIVGYKNAYINTDYRKIEVGKKYIISGEAFIVSGTSYRIRPIIEYQDGTNEFMSGTGGELFNNYFGFPYDIWEKSSVSFIPKKPIKRIYFCDTNAPTTSLDNIFVDLDSLEMRLDNTSNNYEPYIENKYSYILPCQLEGIKSKYFRKGYTDKLYYDNSKKRYVIEKGISEVVKNTAEINNLSFSKGYNPRDNYFVLQLDSKVLANDIQQYSTIIMNNFDFGYNENYKVFLHDNHNFQFFIPVEDLNDNTLESAILKWREIMGDTVKLKYITNSPQLLELNDIPKLENLIADSDIYIYSKINNGILPTLKITVDRIEQVSQEAVNIALSNPTTYNLSLARMLVNQLSESLYKDQLQEQLNNIFSNEVVLEKKNATANVDLYIQSENILQMSLSTNSITFEDFSGVEDMTKENAVSISINSSLPYSLNAYLPTEIQNSDKSNIMDKSILNIKENSELEYKTFSNTVDKIILKDNNPSGNNINHGIDIKLKGNIAHQKDVYKTTIKFEAQQK